MNWLGKDSSFTYMKIKKALHYILSILTMLLGVFLVIINIPNSELHFEKYIPYLGYIASGLGWSIFISIIIFILSFVFGFFLFFTGRSKVPYIKYLTNHLTTIMFGSPMLVVVIVFYFFIGTALKVDSKLVLGIASLTIYFAPFMMKLFVSAYESIDKNQLVVCDLFGFNKIQMYRYVLLPQMVKIMLPPLSGQLSTIIKSSSLLYLIGFKELFYNLSTVQSKTFAYTEGYLIMLVLYLLITIPLLQLTGYLEKRIKI